MVLTSKDGFGRKTAVRGKRRGAVFFAVCPPVHTGCKRNDRKERNMGGLLDIGRKRKKLLFNITNKNLKNFNEQQKIFYVLPEADCV